MSSSDSDPSIRARLVAACTALAWLPPLLTRLCVGWVFVLSGWRKLHNLDKVIEYFGSLGIPKPELQAPFAAGSELVFGALVLVGLFTRLSTVPLMIIMLVAIKTARWEEFGSLDDLYGFIEYLYILLLMWLALIGPGPISLDRIIFRRRSSAA